MCGGAQLHVTDREIFSSYHAGIATIICARNLAPTDFDWRKDAYEFVEEIPAIDLLFGEANAREAIESGASVDEVIKDMTYGRQEWEGRRRSHLIYGEGS